MADDRGIRSERVRAYCCRCQHIQLFKRAHPEHGWHCFLTVVTAGLWLVSWISVSVMAQLQPWRCQRCGWHLPRTAVIRSRSSSRSREEYLPKAAAATAAGLKQEASESKTDGTAP